MAGAGLGLNRAAGKSGGGRRAAPMAKQLGRDQQGITLRGSAEIVAEFFCKGLRRCRGGGLGDRPGLGGGRGGW